MSGESATFCMPILELEQPIVHVEKKHRILLVEDEPSNILVESTFLENLGYQYDVACNGKDVLKKVKARIYSVILMDLNIPGIGGLAATQQLRIMEEEGLMPRTAIVAMTAHALVRDREKCLKAGMDDYIAKPFSQEQLQQKIERNIFLNSLRK